MPVEKTDVIDFLTHHRERKEVSLVMVETRDWKSEPHAIDELQTKLRYYAEFVTGGALARQYPNLATERVVFRVDHSNPITDEVANVLREWAGKLSAIPVGIRSHRMYLNPFNRLLKGLVRRISARGDEFVDWNPTSHSPQPLKTAAQFTQEVVHAMQRVKPEFEIQMVKELEIKVLGLDGHESSFFLDNPYNAYRLNAENETDILQTYVASFFETTAIHASVLDRTRIVPVVKDKDWLQEVQKQAEKSRTGKAFESVHEMYNDELMVVYAEDTPNNMRFLTPANLTELSLDTTALFKLACENLRSILPDPKIEYDNGVYRITVGGDYDACLLLAESFWESAKLNVNGDIVAAVPARDWLIATGSEDELGLKKVKHIAARVASEAPYRLTPVLFVRRDGRFVPFK